jgi:arsenate reductase
VGETPEVLFVCVHNAGRSQMAAALLDHHAGGKVRVRSAGSAPAHEVNRAVVEAMAELGIDVSGNVPVKLLTEDVAASDVVITMGCGDACPIYPGNRYEDWDLPDPAGKSVDDVRRIRDQIHRRVVQLFGELIPGTTTAD